MAYTTTYDVKVRYSVDNRAGNAVGGLVRDTKTLGRESARTGIMFAKLGAIVAGTFGARAAGAALIGFNAQVQDTKNQIAGMLALSKKTNLSDEIGNADRLYASLQKRASTLPGTTQEYVKMAGMLTQPIIDAGLSMKDLEDLTVNSVVGAKALGVEWQAAARDVDAALRGQYHSVDIFTGKVLGSIGYKGEEGRQRFNAMSGEDRASEVKRALMQKQLTQLAAAQGQTFSGVLSTLQDTVEQFLGKVGLPLFKAITAEIKTWNEWISKNADRMDEIAHSVGSGLVSGFRAVKDAAMFISEHSGAILALGKVWAGVKLGGMLASAGQAAAGGVAGMWGRAGWARGASDRFNAQGGYEHTPAGAGASRVGGFRGAMGNIGALSQSLGAGLAIGTVLNEWTGASGAIANSLAHLTGRTDATTDEFDKLQRSSNALDAALRRASGANRPQVVSSQVGLRAFYDQQANLARDALRAKLANDADPTIAKSLALNTALEHMNAAGIGLDDIGKAGGFSAFAANMEANATGIGTHTAEAGGVGYVFMQAAMTQLTDYQKKTLDEAKAQQELLVYINQTLGKNQIINPQTIMDILAHATADPTGKHKATSDKPKVNVTIQRIEVQSDDPDRMAFGLIESFRDAAKNPSSALAALREG